MGSCAHQCFEAVKEVDVAIVPKLSKAQEPGLAPAPTVSDSPSPSAPTLKEGGWS